MPYITPKARRFLDPQIDSLDDTIANPGELTYVIYRLLLKFVSHDRCYETFAKVMGILSCVDKEFYRQEIAPYEDIKIIQNGDVKAS